MDTPITRAEHEEFARRMEDEHHRQNRRIATLEEKVEENSRLTSAVDKLATSVELMAKEQAKQGKRLETLEARDGEMWRKATGYVLTAILSVLVGFIASQIGLK